MSDSPALFQRLSHSISARAAIHAVSLSQPFSPGHILGLVILRKAAARILALVKPVGYIYSYADRKAELTFAKSIVYVIL